MPIEPIRRSPQDVAANVAARRTGTGGIFARVLKATETPEADEWRTVAHVAVCPKAVTARRARKGEISNVIPFPTQRARRARGGKS